MALPQSLGRFVVPGAHKVLFEPSECLWRVWALILNAVLPLLLSGWGFSFALGCGVSFLGGIQHSPVDVCSAVSSRKKRWVHVLLFHHLSSTGHSRKSKHPLPTTQETVLHMDITRWSIPKSDWLYSLQPEIEKLCIVSKNKTRSWLWFRSRTPYCQIET